MYECTTTSRNTCAIQIDIVFAASEDVATDTAKLCSDLITCLSLKPELAGTVGEIIAALASEGITPACGKYNAALPMFFCCWLVQLLT